MGRSTWNACAQLLDHLFGAQHSALVEWLVEAWWQTGSPLAVIQGFPGLGKTEIAMHAMRALSDKSGVASIVYFDCPESTTSLVDDLLLVIAEQLESSGDAEVADAINEGRDPAGIFKRLLTRPRLIVIDEAQRLISPSGGLLRNKTIAGILENISRATSAPGKLLLLSSQEFTPSRWTEHSEIVTLNPFQTSDAQTYLVALLREHDRLEAIPPDRITDVASWLGGNARAIRLLVSALGREGLDFLIGLAPHTWEARDREVSPRLLRDFETSVLERAVEQLDEKTGLLMKRIAVLRKPFRRQVLEALAVGGVDLETSRDELLARYIIEFRSGHYHTHPIIRDTLLTKVSATQRRKAHLIAGRSFATAFRAKEMVGRPEALGERFVEARYHFTLGESEEDLREIASLFETHLKNQYKFVSPVPSDPQERDERITLLSALLKDRGALGLEFHLARCLLARGHPNDTRLAIPHLRRSTGPRSPAQAWVLRIQAEYQINGIPDAIKATREGIKTVPPTQNLFSLYQAAGDILARDGKSEEAVTLLREGSGRIGNMSNGYKLVESAILLTIGLDRVELIHDWPITGMQKPLLDTLTQYAAGNYQDAVKLAMTGIEAYPRYFVLYMQAAIAALAARDVKCARAVFARWPGEFTLAKGESCVWLFSLTEFLAGNMEKARHYLNVHLGCENESEPVTIDDLLQCWKQSCRELGSSLSYHFPRIPTSISGMDNVLVRNEFMGADSKTAASAHAPHEENKAQPDGAVKPASVLAVATEWSSGRGGLSTFNRQLCIAVSKAGLRVACLVLEASEAEKIEAAKQNVALIEANRDLGLSDEQRLMRKPPDIEGFYPDFLIGHGRVTGPAAAALAADHYPTARRLHFVHMAPDEIEAYKLDRQDESSVRAQERTEIEEALGRKAHRVIAVGPRLHGRYSTYFAGYSEVPPPLRFDPGFEAINMEPRVAPIGDPWQILLLGRAEDVTLKGLDVAAMAVAKAAKERAPGLARLELVIRGAQPGSADDLKDALLGKEGAAELKLVIRTFTTSDERLQVDLRRASLVLMPSMTEGFGLVGLEAIVAGTPVLISGESGLGQLLNEVLPPEQAARMVVPMSGERENLLDRWAGHINRVLSDREASFQRAAEVRELLASQKTWRESVRKLLSDLSVT